MKNLKRLLIVCVSLLFVLSMNAQTGAGKIYVGGSSSLSFSATTNKYKSDNGDGTDSKETSFYLAPEAGYFVIDGLAVGLQLDLMLGTYKPDGVDAKSTNSYVFAAPFVKYYYGTGKVKPFAQALVGFGSMMNKQKYQNVTETDKTGMFGFGAGVGAAMFMNDNVAFELGVGYNSFSTKEKQDNPDNVRDIAGSIQFKIGVTVIL